MSEKETKEVEEPRGRKSLQPQLAKSLRVLVRALFFLAFLVQLYYALLNFSHGKIGTVISYQESQEVSFPGIQICDFDARQVPIVGEGNMFQQHQVVRDTPNFAGVTWKMLNSMLPHEDSM